jgi:hypothetical protein
LEGVPFVDQNYIGGTIIEDIVLNVSIELNYRPYDLYRANKRPQVG